MIYPVFCLFVFVFFVFFCFLSEVTGMITGSSALHCVPTLGLTRAHNHTNKVSGVNTTTLSGAYPGVLSDTLTECVTQCANVPSLKQNTKYHANHALSRINEPNFAPQGHFVSQLYHTTAPPPLLLFLYSASAQ